MIMPVMVVGVRMIVPTVLVGVGVEVGVIVPIVLVGVGVLVLE